MTFSEPNPEVRPIGEEAAEFLEPERETDDAPVDPTAVPTGSPPVAPDDSDDATHSA
jgi:hypothetical protein